jgi:ornithine carbamoyltransferase
MDNPVKHFIDLFDIKAHELQKILSHAHELKKNRGNHEKYLNGKSLAMIFEKNSTRTRISFEIAMYELGGHAIMLSAQDLQLGRGETIADTARVLSRYNHAIMMRTTLHEKLLELAQYSTVPVINGLSDLSHPCQIMADLMTIEEKFGTAQGKKIVWLGDGNNVLHSLISATPAFGFELHIACPKPLQPEFDYVERALHAGGELHFHDDVMQATEQADVIVTDTWVSMGHENSETRRQLLTPYQVNDAVLQNAKENAIFLHCLPAHRGEEVTASVIDGAKSAVWDEAENRLHVQKAILCWLLNL